MKMWMRQKKIIFVEYKNESMRMRMEMNFYFSDIEKTVKSILIKSSCRASTLYLHIIRYIYHVCKWIKNK